MNERSIQAIEYLDGVNVWQNLFSYFQRKTMDTKMFIIDRQPYAFYILIGLGDYCLYSLLASGQCIADLAKFLAKFEP